MHETQRDFFVVDKFVFAVCRSPLSPSHSWLDAFVSGSETFVPWQVSSHRCTLKCHCQTVKVKKEKKANLTKDQSDSGPNQTRCQKQPSTCIYYDLYYDSSHHLHHLHLSIDTQVIEEGYEVFLHLDAVVVHLSHGENAHLALSPHLQDKQGTKLSILL